MGRDTAGRLTVKTREFLRCVPTDGETLQEEFAGVVARAVVEPSRDIESLLGRMGESTQQVEGLFESLLAEAFS